MYLDFCQTSMTERLAKIDNGLKPKFASAETALLEPALLTLDRCSENKKQIYRRAPMLKGHFIIVSKNHILAWVFSYTFAA